MGRDITETETLAGLYLDQGQPKRAFAIYEKLLAENPGNSAAREGLMRCKAATSGQGAIQMGDQLDKKLLILKNMLARLRGETPKVQVEEPLKFVPEPQEILSQAEDRTTAQPAAQTPDLAREPVSASIASEPTFRERKLALLRNMLNRLRKEGRDVVPNRA